MFVPSGSRGEVFDLIRRVCIEHKRQSPASPLILSGLMMHLVALLYDAEVSQNDNRRTNDLLRRIDEEAAAQSDGVLSVPKIASKVGLSASHLRRIVRDSNHRRIRDVHYDMRMSRAAELLTYTNLTVSEIAFRLEYSTVHNFSRAFKKAMGVGPRVFRGV